MIHASHDSFIYSSTTIMSLMLEFDINGWAVLIGFIVSSILGFLWYSATTPIGAFYMREMGYDAENLEVNNLWFGLDFLGRLLLMVGFGIVAGFAGVNEIGEGLLLGLILWFFFLVTSHWAQVAFEQRKPTVYGIYVAYQLVVFLIVGFIFGIPAWYG